MQEYNSLPLKSIFILVSFIFFKGFTYGQENLPVLIPWEGQSEQLIVQNDNPWITPTELSNFMRTPTIAETTEWLKKLSYESNLIHIGVAGISAMERNIPYIIASKEKLNPAESPEYLEKQSFEKPIILIQGGIHSGEIDGKDAAMMLLRDIAFNGKDNLLDKVNIIVVPVLNVDGHENSSPFNRPNQRGPENMGWRTNARNLNLNRDFTKIETEGIQAIVGLMKKYDPIFYIDIHVTDGADYQYDITYGYRKKNGYSPAISAWMMNMYEERVDEGLRKMGHIPGPLIFTYKTDDFVNGIIDYALPLRFSDAYGDARHIPSVLVENHSLKPFRQRVLGTYVFLEETIKVISANLEGLLKSIHSDRILKRDSIPLNYGFSKIQNDSITLQLIQHEKKESVITGRQYTHWTAEAITKKVPYIHMDEPQNWTSIPKAYWIPVAWKEIIQKLEMHNIHMEKIKDRVPKELEFYKILDFKMESKPSEGRMRFKEVNLAKFKSSTDPNSSYIRVPVNQELGTLAILLLEPKAADSFFQWGYFNEILSRTEYIESYLMEPMIIKMLETDPMLKEEFQRMKEIDSTFESDPNRIFQWFYAKTPYYDKNWKIIPIGMEY